MPITNITGCIGCGNCARACAMDVIKFNEESQRAEIVYQEDCQICHLCKLYCPVDAITITPEKTLPVMVSWR